ncbi:MULTISPECIES: MerR family DNA-binding transcriptional regulator [unclassified Roseitalea]|uniref:MerR family transcriptional regulator n=1 Tax=unclassified Roseitalea TaxID=2639107 RepID=UPI00273D80DA|nr:MULTISPECIES: MerR family DNA-binding transcriptional regulator [unclassified Roseitalea]
MTSMAPAAQASRFDDIYRIGELAAEFGVTLRTLRFYEDKGLLEPRRVGNTRLYTRRDRARLKLILLGKRVGFSLHEIRMLLDMYEPHGDNRRQLETAAEMGEKQLARLHAEREAISNSIDELVSTLRIVRQMIAERR